MLGDLTISTILTVSERIYPPFDLQILDKLVKAPVKDAFKALEVDYNEAKMKLNETGNSVDEAKNFEDLWKDTDTSPQKSN